MTTTATAQKKSLDSPDEVTEFPKGRIELTSIGDKLFGRAVFEPGWKWSEHVKPIAGTESCEFPHACYVISGSIHVVMDDGTELDVAAGEVFVIGPGHDAWVTSDEPCVVYDVAAEEDEDYAKPQG